MMTADTNSPRAALIDELLTLLESDPIEGWGSKLASLTVRVTNINAGDASRCTDLARFARTTSHAHAARIAEVAETLATLA
jgi:hypothetical protein